MIFCYFGMYADKYKRLYFSAYVICICVCDWINLNFVHFRIAILVAGKVSDYFVFTYRNDVYILLVINTLYKR